MAVLQKHFQIQQRLAQNWIVIQFRCFSFSGNEVPSNKPENQWFFRSLLFSFTLLTLKAHSDAFSRRFWSLLVWTTAIRYRLLAFMWHQKGSNTNTHTAKTHRCFVLFSLLFLLLSISVLSSFFFLYFQWKNLYAIRQGTNMTNNQVDDRRKLFLSLATTNNIIPIDIHRQQEQDYCTFLFTAKQYVVVPCTLPLNGFPH